MHLQISESLMIATVIFSGFVVEIKSCSSFAREKSELCQRREHSALL